MQTPRLPSRSLGLKFLLVCVLAVLMSLPAFAVFGLIYDRTSRAQAVVQEVGARFGGEQSFLGPILVAPYRVIVETPAQQPGMQPQRQVVNGWYMAFAETGEATAQVDTETRARGDLFKVRTYSAELRFAAAFDLTREPSAAPEGAEIDWSRAAILIGVADPRGTQGRAEIQAANRTIPLEPGSSYGQVLPGYVPGNAAVYSPHSVGGRQIQWLVAAAGEFARPGVTFNATAQLRFTGVESISLGAFAKNTEIRISGDWPDVGYFGAFPAQPLETTQGGFDARWSIPYVARGVAAAGASTDLGALANTDVQVRFIDPANPYQSVTRSLKYALLFIGVVFLAYFLFEATGDKRVHPAQYILVGLAQIIFYLLLLAIAERLGFDYAFLTAAGATATLIAIYLGAIFKSFMRGLLGLIVFSILYALIYLLMRIEDYALLAGSIAAFVAVALVMWFTRNLDWYGLSRKEEAIGQ